jgi:hypothetical protein
MSMPGEAISRVTGGCSGIEPRSVKWDGDLGAASARGKNATASTGATLQGFSESGKKYVRLLKAAEWLPTELDGDKRNFLRQLQL